MSKNNLLSSNEIPKIHTHGYEWDIDHIKALRQEDYKKEYMNIDSDKVSFLLKYLGKNILISIQKNWYKTDELPIQSGYHEIYNGIHFFSKKAIQDLVKKDLEILSLNEMTNIYTIFSMPDEYTGYLKGKQELIDQLNLKKTGYVKNGKLLFEGVILPLIYKTSYMYEPLYKYDTVANDYGLVNDNQEIGNEILLPILSIKKLS